MHNENVHIKSGCKVHEILLDYAVGAGVGRVVARAYGHISGVCRDVVDAVRNNLTVRERPEVVIERTRLTRAEHFPVTLEVADEFFLLGVDADNGDAYCRSLLSDVSDIPELDVPALNIPHRDVLAEGTVAVAERFKYLPDNVLGDIAVPANHLPCNLWNGQGHPDDVLILRKTRSMRSDNHLEGVNPFRMLREQGLAAASATADPSIVRSVVGFDFLDAVIQSVFAGSNKLTNFVHATSAKGKSLGCEKAPSLVFAERRHKRQFFCCKHFWRRLRNHFEKYWDYFSSY